MKEDQIKWDSRYQQQTFPDKVSEIVKRFSHLAKTGNALDIAAGIGRNTCFLVEKGFDVEAVDISEVGLDTISSRCPKALRVQTDLDDYQIKKNNYDLICNINYLQRRLFPYIIEGLRPGGLLIFETFMDPRLVGRSLEPSKEKQYLKTNELLHAFLNFQVIFYQEKEVTFANGEPIKRATLVASKQIRH